MGISRMGFAQLFSSHKHDMHTGRTKKPLVISSPIGPVKNSRGADFTRSDGLIIVDAIKDCGPPKDDDEFEDPGAVFPEKKMAISMFARKTLFKTQSLASLSSASRGVMQASSTTPRRRVDDDLSSLSKLKSASASTTTIFTDTGDHEYTHATRLPDHGSLHKSKLKFATKLPQSKTMNVLQDIKNSVPYRRNVTSTISKPHIKKLDASLKPSDAPRVVVLRSLTRRSQEESVSSSTRSSTTNITTPDSSKQMNDAVETPPNPRQIVHAQPSAYWSGRFTTLRDHLCNEHMACVLSKATDTIQTGISGDSTRDGRSHDLQLSGNPPYPLQDEDDLCRQVFTILESQCITKAAKMSLTRWREKFAIRRCRPNLLPHRGGFLGDSQISKRFASSGRHQDVQSLAFLEDAYYSNASNAFGMTHPHSLEGRYLNFR
ncbi:hypothetical protein BB8028_0006g10580 [Beauveria bassiana]|uniref:Uncharacterized protein n=1 Tax=Beauveria bassiana TaxID=176275 RepID=A0A2S7YLC0_BEABA|nr:hypothetical protein BB8028_0006g10580 [Beauveria bassiana]